MGYISSTDVKYIKEGAREEQSARNKTTKVLASTDQNTWRQGAGVGTVINGTTPVMVRYQDEAGRWVEGCSKHTVEHNVGAKSSNVPAEVYSEPVPNVAARFAR